MAGKFNYSNNPSIYDKGNAFTQPLGLLDIVSGKKDGGSFAVKISDHLSYLASTGDINPRGWFI